MDLNEAQRLIKEHEEEFASFFALLSETNKIMNLTALTDEKEVYLKHFADSVAPCGLFPEGADVAEIGSGGGFPSVPLKIVRPDLKFTLIESTGKKCAYLEKVVDKLSLGGVKVLNIRAEEGARRDSLREKFDVACARGVARLNTLCEYCLPYVKTGGAFIAYKGDADGEIKEAENAVKTLGGRLEKVFRYSLSGEASSRCAIVIRKVKPTPAAYPRGRGKERKNPL